MSSKFVNDDAAGIEVHVRQPDGSVKVVDAKDAPAEFKRRAAKQVSRGSAKLRAAKMITKLARARKAAK